MTVIFKKPLTFEIGVGITGSLNGEAQSTMSMDASDSVSVTFEIPQEVGPDSSPTFGEVSASGTQDIVIGTDESNIVLHYHGISGSGTIGPNLTISENFTSINNLHVDGTVISKQLTFGSSSASTIFASGSTKFGDTADDVTKITGSFSPQNLSFKGGSKVNHTTNNPELLERTGSLVTEFAAKTYLESLNNYEYLRKSFVHKGNIQNNTIVHFNAVTASSGDVVNPTSEHDFYFFINGFNAEPDALSIQQNNNTMILTVDTGSIGYDLNNQDEIVAIGKFNS